MRLALYVPKSMPTPLAKRLNKFRQLGFIDYNGGLRGHIYTPGVQL
jgi:hypothetical protein